MQYIPTYRRREFLKDYQRPLHPNRSRERIPFIKCGKKAGSYRVLFRFDIFIEANRTVRRMQTTKSDIPPRKM